MLLGVALTVPSVAAEASFAAVARTSGVSAAASGGADACADPCPVIVFKKGAGTGRVWSTPPGIDCGVVCGNTFDDTQETTLWARADPGSLLLAWEGCPRMREDGACTIPAGSAVGLAVCPLFVPLSSPLAPPAGCPPVPEAPPPPAPTGPPPLGARCTIPGSPGADVIRGTAGRDVICGNGGNDRIYGGGGHDLLVGGRGDDKLYGQAGRDRLAGGAGADLLVGGGADDELLGGSGADLLSARDGIRERVNGGSGRDRARVDRSDRVRAVERRL